MVTKPRDSLGATTDHGRRLIDFPSQIGVWWASDRMPIDLVREIAREIEALGYGSLFFPEVAGKEALTQAAAVLSATDRLVVGTGIANIYARIPSAAEAGARTLSSQYPRRFVLGLGVSHAPLVEHQIGATYTKPLATMRRYLETMQTLPTDIEPGGARPVVLLGAQGPKMVELSATHADGAHPAFVLPQHTAQTRSELGGRKWLVPIQAVVTDGAIDERLQWAHAVLGYYTQLPNYRNSWLRQGFEESDLVGAGSDRLARALFVMDSVDAAAAVLRSHLDAGADHVLLGIFGGTPIGVIGAGDPRQQLRALAAALQLGQAH